MTETDLRDIPNGYYAVPDPDHPERMTYWRMSRRGTTTKFGPWPAKARYGPAMRVADVPKDPDGRRQVIERYSVERARYSDAILAAVAAAPAAAGKRFAQFCTRCCICGRVLTDDYSKVVAVGPECRRGASADSLAQGMAPLVGAAHANAEAKNAGEEE